MATREIWQGEGGDWFSKDEYGNVFDQSGGMVGNDAPTPALGGPPPGYQGGVGPNGAWSLAGPFQVEGSNAQGPYSYQSPGFPTQYQTPFNSPFSGGGGGGAAAPSGVGVQPGIDWAKLDLDRQKLAAEIQHNQQYLSYLQQQLAQQAKTDAERIAIEHERVGIERQLAGLQQQKFELEKQMDEFQRGMAIQQTIANPRNFVQSLMLMGASPTQAAGYLQSLPVVQQLGAAPARVRWVAGHRRRGASTSTRWCRTSATCRAGSRSSRVRRHRVAALLTRRPGGMRCSRSLPGASSPCNRPSPTSRATTRGRASSPRSPHSVVKIQTPSMVSLTSSCRRAGRSLLPALSKWVDRSRCLQPSVSGSDGW
jgi:hypothetical protein